MNTRPRPASGFTLIEAIVVIVIMSILFTMVGLFIRLPVAGAVDTARRAALSDTADLALRRIKREVQGALPNSVRATQSGGSVYIEFVPVMAGGRYCVENCTLSTGTVLTPAPFETPNNRFSVVGPLVSQPGLDPTVPMQAVIFNLGIPGEDTAAPSSSIYDVGNANPNFAAVGGITSAGGAISIVLTAPKIFPMQSPGNRFHLVGRPVSYVCTPGVANGSGTGTLRRYTGYATQAAQPTAFGAVPGRLLADRVSDCRLNQFAQEVSDRFGLLALSLQLMHENERVTLTHEIQINNMP